jgi:O-antigen ligase
MFGMAYALFLWLQRRFKNKALETLLYSLLLISFSFFFLISQTRGAFLGLLAAIFCFLVYMTITHKPARKWTGGILLLAVMGMGLLFSLGQTPAIQKLPIGRLFNVGFTEQTAQTRFWTWNTAWQGFKDRPLFGWGPENFSTVFDLHFDQRHFNPKASSETWFDRAHSVLFDYLAETGFFGILSFVSLFVVFYLQFFGFKIFREVEGSKADTHRENFHLSPWAWGLIAVVPIGYLVQGLILFDVLPIYINLFFFLALASFIFRTGPTQVNK